MGIMLFWKEALRCLHHWRSDPDQNCVPFWTSGYDFRDHL